MCLDLRMTVDTLSIEEAYILPHHESLSLPENPISYKVPQRLHSLTADRSSRMNNLGFLYALSTLCSFSYCYIASMNPRSSL